MTRVHALWLLNHFKALSTKQLISSLNDMHPGVRENALRLAETQNEPSVIATAAKLTDDPDAKVRLQLAFTLGAWQSPVAGTALGKLMTQYHSDPFMKAACFSSSTPHLPALVESVMLASDSTRTDLSGSLAELALAVNAHSSLATLLEPVFYSASGTYTLDQMQAALQFTSMAARRGTDLNALKGKHEGPCKNPQHCHLRFCACIRLKPVCRPGPSSYRSETPCSRRWTFIGSIESSVELPESSATSKPAKSST
jgi:hypothetical protein